MNTLSAKETRMYSHLARLLVSLLGFAVAIFMPSDFAAAKEPLDPRIREIKTIFISEAPGEGSSDAAVTKGALAERALAILQQETCYKLASDKETADAILLLSSKDHLKVAQDGGGFAVWISGSTVAAQLTHARSGDVLWSAQKAKDRGSRGLSAAEGKTLALSLLDQLFRELNKVGCKGKK